MVILMSKNYWIRKNEAPPAVCGKVGSSFWAQLSISLKFERVLRRIEVDCDLISIGEFSGKDF